MKYKLIIWDWNGTIVNDVLVALGAVNKILEKRQMKPITLEQYYSYLETPIIKFYEHLFDFSKVDFNEIAEEFSEYYDELLPEFPLFMNSYYVLHHLYKDGVKQIIVSGSKTEKITSVLQRFNLMCYFDDIIGADDHFAESKLERGTEAIKKLNVEPSECLVVGDTVHDDILAKEIGADCVLFSGGHQSKKDLESRHVTVIDDMVDLLDYIK